MSDGYVIVPQAVVNALAPALSSDENRGAVIAEQVCRSPAGALIMKLQAGQELTPEERVQLPPLRDGFSWDRVQMRIQAAEIPEDELLAGYFASRRVAPTPTPER